MVSWSVRAIVSRPVDLAMRTSSSGEYFPSDAVDWICKSIEFIFFGNFFRLIFGRFHGTRFLGLRQPQRAKDVVKWPKCCRSLSQTEHFAIKTRSQPLG